MTVDEMKELLEDSDDYLKKESVTGPHYSDRSDLQAFMMLDRLVPGKADIIAGADHDIIYLGVSEEALAVVATEEDIKNLRRCGVFYSDEYDSLCMFA